MPLMLSVICARRQTGSTMREAECRRSQRPRGERPVPPVKRSPASCPLGLAQGRYGGIDQRGNGHRITVADYLI
jgi:hypothetical protein